MRITIDNLGFYAHEWGAGIPPALNWGRLVELRWSDALGPGAAVTNVSATLDNSDGALTQWFSVPPLGAEAWVEDSAGNMLLDGVLTQVNLGQAVTLTIEA